MDKLERRRRGLRRINVSLAFEGFRGRRRGWGWDRGSIVSVRGRHEEEENESMDVD